MRLCKLRVYYLIELGQHYGDVVRQMICIFISAWTGISTDAELTSRNPESWFLVLVGHHRGGKPEIQTKKQQPDNKYHKWTHLYSVQLSPLSDWVVGGTRGTIPQRSSSKPVDQQSQEVDLAPHTVVGLVLQVENTEKFPHVRGFESLDLFLFLFFKSRQAGFLFHSRRGDGGDEETCTASPCLPS